jgi:hypothetical protein
MTRHNIGVQLRGFANSISPFTLVDFNLLLSLNNGGVAGELLATSCHGAPTPRHLGG